MGGVDSKKLKEMLKEIESLDKVIENLKMLEDISKKQVFSEKSLHKRLESAENSKKFRAHIKYLEGYKAALKKNLEEESADTKKKQEKLQMIKTGYYLAGIYNREFAGFTPDVVPIFKEGFIERFPKYNEVVLNVLMEHITSVAEEKHLEPEKIINILDDKEFADMARNDPNRLLRKKKSINAEFDSIIAFVSNNEGMKLKKNEDGSVDKDSARENFKNHMKNKNGFELSLVSFDRYLDKVTQRDFEDIIQEVKELAVETRKRQDEFINNDATFDKNNGYTRELLEKEIKVFQKVVMYNQNMAVILEKAADPLQPGSIDDLFNGDFFARYPLMRELDFNLRRQVRIDECLVRNNELIKRMEEWDIYRDMQERISNFDENGKKEFNKRLKASTKVQRVLAEASENGSVAENYSDYVAIETQNMLDILSKQGDLNQKDRQVLMKGVATLTIFEMVKNCKGMADPDCPKYVADVRNFDHFDNYDNVAEELINDDGFKKKFAKMFGKNPGKTDFYGFLAKNKEKDLVPEPIKAPVLQVNNRKK